MIKYIGSKRDIVPLLEALAHRLPISSVCDMFAGTTRVGQAFRRAGCRVVSNDLASYSAAFGQAYIAAGADLDRERLRALIARLQTLPGAPGYATETFCVQARYFSPENGARIDAVRAMIEDLDVDEVMRGCLLTSLIQDKTIRFSLWYPFQWPRTISMLAHAEELEAASAAGNTCSRPGRWARAAP